MSSRAAASNVILRSVSDEGSSPVLSCIFAQIESLRFVLFFVRSFIDMLVYTSYDEAVLRLVYTSCIQFIQAVSYGGFIYGKIH